MKTKSTFVSIIAIISLSGLVIAGPKTYQVTGPVLEVTPTSVTVQKGDEKWEVTRDGTTKITGDLKVGSKVTVTYTMNAGSIEVKGGADAAPTKAADGAKKAKK